MISPVSWVRDRLGERGAALALLALLLALAVVPVVALPAARCEVFGSGCRTPDRGQRADPVAAPVRALDPVAAATRGSYVALGDSYSAGVGAEATVADQNPLDRCHRTSKAYYHEVAQAFRFSRGTAFWACSGATTDDVLDGRGGEPPQIGRVGQDTSLITISIGGNDVGFSRVLAGCVVKLPWGRGCTAQGKEIARRMAELRQSLPALLARITERAPYARVIVMSYPKAFSEVSGVEGDNITVADQRWLNARAYELAGVIRQSVVEADARKKAGHRHGSVEFVDAYSAFAGHEVGSRDAYMNGLTLNLSALEAEPRSYHPTVAGQRALARLFVGQVRKGPDRPLT
ncbi:SGNH/GDSL hydrolase family protein [Actinomadura sp. DSM 109109]|nr:SGNH/GDSL hydrolase family protein [Actinomadura lepetitiana]